MYFLLGISLIFAFLLIINMVVAAGASALWKIISGSTYALSVGTRAEIIFGLRISPIAASLVFVFAFLAPSYLLHEPASSGEVISGKLGLLAIISCLVIAIALYRVLRTWTATRRLTSNWLKDSVEIGLDNMNVPIYKIKHRFPVIAVIGIIRPRIFVAERVLESIDGNEFAAAIAHEYGHLRAKDNFKRTLLRVCRDMLIFPMGEALDRAWAENAELVADEYAARRGGSMALDLASALVKIARIAEPGTGPAMPAGAYLLKERDLDIASRVRRLIVLSEAEGRAKRKVGLRFSPLVVVSAAAFAVLAILPFVEQRFLTSTHDVVERFVAILR